MSALCGIAIDAIAVALVHGTKQAPPLDGLPRHLTVLGASFVTLERDGQLLGCVGALEARKPLAIDVAEHALAAAFDDPRLPAVTPRDYSEMSVKVSVLSPSSRLEVHSIDALRSAVQPGIDGVTIESGRARATLLPSVWEKLADRDEFLDALWLKAGLRPRTWAQGLRVSRYTTTEETDPGPRAPLACTG